MNVKILKSSLILLSLLIFSGCSTKIQKEIVYVPQIQIEKVPVKCVLVKPSCYMNQPKYTKVINEMAMCIERYKEVFDNCNKE